MMKQFFCEVLKAVLNNNKNKADLAIQNFKKQKNLDFLYEKHIEK